MLNVFHTLIDPHDDNCSTFFFLTMVAIVVFIFYVVKFVSLYSLLQCVMSK